MVRGGGGKVRTVEEREEKPRRGEERGKSEDVSPAMKALLTSTSLSFGRGRVRE